MWIDKLVEHQKSTNFPFDNSLNLLSLLLDSMIIKFWFLQTSMKHYLSDLIISKQDCIYNLIKMYNLFPHLLNLYPSAFKELLNLAFISDIFLYEHKFSVFYEYSILVFQIWIQIGHIVSQNRYSLSLCEHLASV